MRPLGAGLALLLGLIVMPAAQAAAAGLTMPSSITFPNEVFGLTGTTSVAKPVTITNPSTGQAVTGLGGAVGGINARDFRIASNNCPSPLNPGNRCQILLTFTPTGLGTRTGTFTVSYTGNSNVKTVALTGNGVQGKLSFPSTVTFVNTVVGASSQPRSVTITNVNEVALHINSVAISGNYSIAGDGCSGNNVAAGAHCIVAVVFSPTSLGTLTGALSLTDDGLGSPQSIVLTGNGALALPKFKPAGLTYGTVIVGTTSAAKTTVVTNPNTLAMTINSISITSGPFAITSNTCGKSLAAGQSCNISANFSPPAGSTAGVTLSGALTVADNAVKTSQAVKLSGTPGGTAATPAPPPPGGSSSVSVSGSQLVDANDNTVFLHGVNRDDFAYACADGSGIYSGPVDQTQVNDMLAWHINAVRLPLNEDCWLGINGVKWSYSGANYQNAVANFVSLLESNNIYVILDLHWNAPGTYISNSQEPMADADHAPAFWTSVAQTFTNHPGVIFDLYNEPWLPTANFSCWANGGCTTTCNYGGKFGGSCPRSVSYSVAGMGQLLAAVRTGEGSGWHHPVMIGGLGCANDLSGWLANVPEDSASPSQIIANAHAYHDNLPCETTSCFTSTWGPIIKAGYPLTLNEFGDLGSGGAPSCTWTTWLNNVMNWFQNNGASGYTAWVWDGGAGCGDPGLITDWAGSSTSYGSGYKTHLLNTFP
jgi:endoglucanase